MAEAIDSFQSMMAEHREAAALVKQAHPKRDPEALWEGAYALRAYRYRFGHYPTLDEIRRGIGP